MTQTEIPDSARKQVTLRLPVELLTVLRGQAQEMGGSLNETVIRYIRLGLESESRRYVPRNGELHPS